MIHHDFRTVSPDIVEQIEQDVEGFVPYQPDISLRERDRVEKMASDFYRPDTYLRESWSGDSSEPFPFLSF